MKRRPVLQALHILVIVAVALGGSACGGSSSEELANARREGRLEERQKQQREEQKRLRREIEQLKNRPRTEARKPSQGTPAPSPPPAPAPPSGGTTSCDNGLRVGPNTTCAFAEMVRAAYPGGTGAFEAYSPVTGLTYTMSCTDTSPNECRGGNGASVFFP